MRSLARMMLSISIVGVYLIEAYHLQPSHSLTHSPLSSSNRLYKNKLFASTIEDADSSLSSSSNVSPAPVARTPIGSTPQFAIPGDSTQETTFQRLIFSMHWLLTAANIIKALSSIHPSTPIEALSLTSLIAFSVILGDFATGVFHWSVDNYGSLKTPIVGSVCAAFQGHHVTPWTITFRSFVNNVYKICIPTVPCLVAIGTLPIQPSILLFFTLFINWWMISQELHKYAHMRNLPPLVKTMQDLGLMLSRKEHGLHHTAPFEAHYCILTGWCNPLLDGTKFFRYLEYAVFKLTGIRANTWKEDASVEALAINLFERGNVDA